MSYVRRRNSIHFRINGHRIRKDVFWRWFGASATVFLVVMISIAWLFYSKDEMVHQTASYLMERLAQLR